MNINIGDKPHVDGVDNPQFYQFCLERSKAMREHNARIDRENRQRLMEEQAKYNVPSLIIGCAIMLLLLLIMGGC